MITHRFSTKRARAAGAAIGLAALGIASLGIASLGVAPAALAQTAAKGEPLMVGVSGPLTGQYAQYGAQWKKGFDLAVELANAEGGVKGRPVAYVFEDSQSDPRQSVAIARKFVADERILVEIGDFSSAASMAASPIYQAAGLVQFGFTNSHPDFTKGGDFMWSNAPNQADEMPTMATIAVEAAKVKRVAAMYINNDWGRTAKDIFAKAMAERGGFGVADHVQSALINLQSVHQETRQ